MNFYNALAKAAIERVAINSNLCQIEQEQKYSQTKFTNPETGDPLSYPQMLNIYRRSKIHFRGSGFEPSVTQTFEEFITPFITNNNQP